MYSEQTDEQLARAAQYGETAAFSELVGRYQAKLIRYAKRFLFATTDAEDLVQEVFLKSYANLQGFDTGRKFSSWIYRIAHNEFINALKRKGKEPIPFFDPDTLFPHPIATEKTDREVNDKDLRTTLDACLDQLNPKYREPLVLYYYEELSYHEIAEILHIPLSTVGVRIKRGKETLRSIYHKMNTL